jgi:hypothetical protein
VKGLNAANTHAAVNEVKLALGEKIFDAREALNAAQTAQADALDRISQLEKEVARLKAWDGEKDRYELKQLYRGPFAFIFKQGKEEGEDPHALCTNCYERGFKSYLQMGGQTIVHDRTWSCPACKFSVKGQWPNMAEWIKKTREPSS